MKHKVRVTRVSGDIRLPIVGHVLTIEGEPIDCCGCDTAIVTTVEKAMALGWVWQTQFDGAARWLCPTCKVSP